MLKRGYPTKRGMKWSFVYKQYLPYYVIYNGPFIDEGIHTPPLCAQPYPKVGHLIYKGLQMKKLLILLPFALMLAGCTSSSLSAGPIIDAEAVALAKSEGIEITFNGDSCSNTGPDVITAGEYLFKLNNLSGEGAPDLWLGRFTGGYTYQDFLDAQGEPGNYISKPDNLDQELTRVVDFDLSTGQKTTTYLLEEGEYAIYIFNPSGAQWGQWICAPLTVVESAP